MKEEYYIGLDVHKKTIAIAYIKSDSRREATYYGTCGGGIIPTAANGIPRTCALWAYFWIEAEAGRDYEMRDWTRSVDASGMRTTLSEASEG